MFAGFILEKEYPTLAVVPDLFEGWLRLWGPIAIALLLLIEAWRQLTGRGSMLTHGLSGRLSRLPVQESWKLRTFWLLLIVTVGGLAAAGIITFMIPPPSEGGEISVYQRWSQNVYTWVACLAAVLAVCWEFLIDLFQLSPRRIWAIARLSIKESIRRKALWSFCIILMLFLFASWFIRTDKPEHQWRVYVDLIFFVVAALMLITASVLACFSLPTDIKHQTIHTIVTKPVQKFEIVLGRILGFSLLMTIVLLIVAHLSLLYVFRGLDPAARQDSMRARVPVFGTMGFQVVDERGNIVPSQRGINVGREWEYRQYIRGGSTMEAVWTFPSVPSSLSRERRMIPIEFSFDIFRTSKGGEDYKEGVTCQIAFVNKNQWTFGRYPDYRQAMDSKTSLGSDPFELAKEFGYYELRSPITINDYENYVVEFPSTLLENAGPDTFEIRVSCRSIGQYLGVAKHDLYVLANEGSFYLNYLKGVASIWFLMLLIVTLGVVFSTYLNALVGLLLTWLMVLGGTPVMRLLISGLSLPFNAETNPGGGPGEAAYRMMKQINIISPLEQNRGVWLIQSFDELMRYFFKALLAVLPDLHQFLRTTYVAEGFDVPGTEMLASVVLLIVYLVPFLVGGYYVLNVREIAK